MSKTVVFRDERYIDHLTTPGHPECPQRLVSIYETLDNECGFEGYQACIPREATREELALNHTERYIEAIAATAAKKQVSLDPDTNTSAGSWTAAKLAAGAVLDGCDMLLDGRAGNVLALVRPPGHHAEADRAMGFCLFNNVAVGARYLLQRHGLERVMIFDWDIHHGNGTQHSFYDMSEVLYASTHQYPYYPGTGALQETGTGAGSGYTVNIPLPGGQGDEDYLKVLAGVIAPIARAYRPQVLIVSAGYDIHERDPLGTMSVTPVGFGRLTAALKRLAAEVCEGRLLLALEGGYNISGIAESIKHTLAALVGHDEHLYAGPDGSAGAVPLVDRVIEDVQKVHSSKWGSCK